MNGQHSTTIITSTTSINPNTTTSAPSFPLHPQLSPSRKAYQSFISPDHHQSSTTTTIVIDRPFTITTAVIFNTVVEYDVVPKAVLGLNLDGEGALGVGPALVVKDIKESAGGDDANRYKNVQRVSTGYMGTGGFSLLRDPHHNKGLAFTEKERDAHYLRGLLPPICIGQGLQEKKLMQNLRQYQVPLQKYMAMMDLQERNERLFYKLLVDNVEELLPIVYTPTVGEACQKGKILEVLKNWPERSIQVIVVTDGERILGLGDLGCQGLPITIDVGTNNEQLLKDEFYIGLRQKRATGQEYHDFMYEFMCAVKQNYGEKVLIQFEDFANHNAFDLLAKYGTTHLVFNDDIQAGTGIAELIALEMSKKTKLPIKETRKKIWLVDSKAIKPTVLIGTSGVGKTFTKEVVEAMSSFNEGRVIFASGSPFDPVEHNGKTFIPGQANNAYIFPGLGLGLVISGTIRVHDDMLLAASEALAQQVTQENFENGLIYPPFKSIRNISANIAANVAAKAYELGLATRLPRPADLVKYTESCMYTPIYRNYR
ncbi:hypothetical protein QJS10_CPA06g00823 [Acorus calamus]|uniref:Malic enzyme n=1 Tax=Acorus calamus TaxID=4465 RepID=A0AAV9EQH1_ACOCL|nr:hypothetical protein QJS10_CPA06g00823 [Acorus calamus]